jgi:hypothetical protein
MKEPPDPVIVLVVDGEGDVIDENSQGIPENYLWAVVVQDGARGRDTLATVRKRIRVLDPKFGTWLEAMTRAYEDIP